jgi:cytosine/adenosine deaminase-related metal-dependent hydrolase
MQTRTRRISTNSPRRPYLRLSAPFVWPAVGPLIHDGAVLVGPAGTIDEVGPADAVPSPPDADVHTFEGCVLLPGLINAHTHLELHSLQGRVEEDDFFDWIRGIKVAKEELSEEAFVEAARVGVRDTWRWGVTTVADTGTSGATVPALSELGGHGVYYHEAITPDPSAVDAVFGDFEVQVDRLRDMAGAGVRVGVSPHAPYSAHEDLYRRVVGLADRVSLPLAGHVAESLAETAFVTKGQGPFADLWRSRGFDLPSPRRSPVQFAADQGLLRPEMLAIHAVQVDDEDVALLAACDAAVVSCPRSNARHGHGPPPLGQLVDAGVRVGLGTDSIVSVGSVDMLAEARAACALEGITPEIALHLLTRGAASALGLDQSTGAIVRGLRADLCVVDVAAVRAGDGAEAVLDERARVAATVVGGRFVYRGGSGVI